LNGSNIFSQQLLKRNRIQKYSLAQSEEASADEIDEVLQKVSHKGGYAGVYVSEYKQACFRF